jgi:hypothetical protein
MLLLVAAVATAAAIYGPDLVERYTGDDTASTTDEVPAPLVFPAPPLAAPVVRTATFTVEESSGATDVESTRVTVDFDTQVARTVFERATGTDVEVLSAFDEAVVRDLNGSTWYTVDRGSFPFDGVVDRARYAPTVDTLIPPEQRATTTITSATYSVVNDIPTTHLVLDRSGTPVEIWVDEAGIVRKQVEVTPAGTTTITLLDVSAEAWVPEFPLPEQFQPFTAAALAQLGF